MPTLFADELHGPAWDRVRQIRRDLLGDDGVALDGDAVPPAFKPLLPYASLLTTGEEGALLDFWDALGPSEQEALRAAIAPQVGALRDFGLYGDAKPPEHHEAPEAPRAFDFSPERLAEMLDVVKAEMDQRPRPTTTQEAMLDLARLYDLVSARRRRKSTR
jgi:hypothetical protein